MKVLVAWPPQVPSYFNAGHHLPVFTIATYLRAQGYDAEGFDAGVLNCHWKEFGDRVFQGGYDVVVIVNDFDVVEGVRRAADYIRALSPATIIITVGRLSYQIPGFFRSFALDAIVSSGDYEAGVLQVLKWLPEKNSTDSGLSGVELCIDGVWKPPVSAGKRLPSEEWCLPDITEIPYADYENLYKTDQNKFCGIPQRRELVVPVARGCPIGCAFCDVPKMQGLRERRISVKRVIEYIKACFIKFPFDYIAFYAPTFTLNKHWVKELCVALNAQPRLYPWKCATTIHHLDEDLINLMSASGCRRISVGVETFEKNSSDQLPKLKRKSKEKFMKVASWCENKGVELNCFVVVGLPGTTPKGTQDTIDIINSVNARVRPTLYTPYENMTEDMTERTVSQFNRHLFINNEKESDCLENSLDFIKFIFGSDHYVTPVTKRIPISEGFS